MTHKYFRRHTPYTGGEIPSKGRAMKGDDDSATAAAAFGGRYIECSLLLVHLLEGGIFINVARVG